MFNYIFSLESIAFQNADIKTFLQCLLMCLLQKFIWIQFLCSHSKSKWYFVEKFLMFWEHCRYLFLKYFMLGFHNPSILKAMN